MPLQGYYPQRFRKGGGLLQKQEHRRRAGGISVTKGGLPSGGRNRKKKTWGTSDAKRGLLPEKKPRTGKPGAGLYGRESKEKTVDEGREPS